MRVVSMDEATQVNWNWNWNWNWNHRGTFHETTPFWRLTSKHGRGKSEREARQIPNTVSAYLFFADNADLNPRHLADALKMNSYLDHLQESGKSATSQHATLCRLKQGLSFHTLSLKSVDVPRAERCLTLISNWLSALGKEARRAKRDHLEDMSA